MRKRMTWDKSRAAQYQVPPVDGGHPASKPEPTADQFENGDTSSWAEDVVTDLPHDEPVTKQWPNVTNGPEQYTNKSAAVVRASTRAVRCVRIASAMLGAAATEQSVENVAMGLMARSDAHLDALAGSFLASEDEGEGHKADFIDDFDMVEDFSAEPVDLDDDVLVDDSFVDDSFVDDDELDPETQEMLDSMLAEEEMASAPEYSPVAEEENLYAQRYASLRVAHRQLLNEHEVLRTAYQKLSEVVAEQLAEDDAKESEEKAEDHKESAKKASTKNAKAKKAEDEDHDEDDHDETEEVELEETEETEEEAPKAGKKALLVAKGRYTPAQLRSMARQAEAKAKADEDEALAEDEHTDKEASYEDARDVFASDEAAEDETHAEEEEAPKAGKKASVEDQRKAAKAKYVRTASAPLDAESTIQFTDHGFNPLDASVDALTGREAAALLGNTPAPVVKPTIRVAGIRPTAHLNEEARLASLFEGAPDVSAHFGKK